VRQVFSSFLSSSPLLSSTHIKFVDKQSFPLSFGYKALSPDRHAIEETMEPMGIWRSVI
jgi:hypothetical protein